MSSERTYPVGPPRLDRDERLRHRLYEPLVLLWMFNPAKGSCHALPGIGQHSDDFASLWQEFLDALSWFCDSDHGGKTVSSVAAEETPDGNRFWLASKRDKSLPHLRSVLKTLESVRSKTEAECTAIARDMAESAIEFSKDKIKNYRGELTKSVTSARKKTAKDELAKAEDLLQTLDDLISPESSPLELCQMALAFDSHGPLDRLIQATSKLRVPSEWSPVRHYIARLRSWHRKSVHIVSFAKRYPELFDQHSCEWIQLPASTKLPPSDSKTNLLSVLQRMLPSDQKERAKQLYDSMNGLRDFDLDLAFDKAYSSVTLSLEVHSELYLMEHFYLNHLPFVERCRVIGCSKPSCYCCSLYMRYHPGNFHVRASHGTAWVPWSPPLMSRVGESAEIRKHNLDVVNLVNQHLRRDILIEIEDRFPRRRRLPDSTSGLASQSY